MNGSRRREDAKGGAATSLGASEIADRLRRMPVAGPGSPQDASIAAVVADLRSGWGDAAYVERANSWDEGAWTERPGFQAKVGCAAGERVRGPYTTHRTGNGVHVGAEAKIKALRRVRKTPWRWVAIKPQIAVLG